MIDVHAHIIYGIDDGARTISESEKLIESAIKNNVKAIFLTPHYILDSKYLTNNKKKKLLLNKLKEKYSKDIDLYLGNEIYMNDYIAELIEKKEISPLGDSKYLLIELPVYNEYPNLENYLFKLRDLGYKIIIAHPERYYYFYTDFDKVLNFCRQGIYFQGNYMSLYNTYGKSAKKLFVKILKHHCYTFMASDIHHPSQNYYKKIAAAKHKIIEFTSKEYADDIFYNNAAKIITDDHIEVKYKEKLSIIDRIRGN